MRVNDIPFADILEDALALVFDDEAYEVVPLIQYDGTMLDLAWKKATHKQKSQYRWYIDAAWRENVKRAARINELTA